MRCYIAQWHSGMKSRPPFWIWTLDGFRHFAHARVITDLKNMADYHQERTLTEGFRKAKTKTRTTATRPQENPENRYMLEKGREAQRNDSGLKHKTSLLNILFAL